MIKLKFFKFQILLIIINFFIKLNANEIIGCGGFIKSNTEINYNIIQVKLFTKDKILKYTTESSSVNGYYMIPVYNKGEYVLKVEPPPGWSFDPTEIPLNIDGVNDACSKNEDINFYFKGFGLSGKVITYGDVNRKGPANVKLDLLLNNEIVGTTNSAVDGSYYFSNVMPGNYQVRAVHSTWKFKIDTVSVTLSKDNWSAKDNIIVSGYTIEGYVLSADKKPLPNAIVALKFNSANPANLDTSNYECEKNEKIIDSDEICHVKTNDQGKYQFSNIAFQKYSLKAIYRVPDSSIVIFSKPDLINVELLKHDNLVVNDKFEINNLNLSPKAILIDNSNNNVELPVENVQVFINDKEFSEKTASNGEFKLNNLIHGASYKVSFKSEHVYFEEKSIQIDLSLKSIKETIGDQLKNFLKFYVKSFDVCGKIKFKQEIKSSDLVRLAKIIRLKVFQYVPNKNDEINVRYININENLSYCFKLNKSPIDYVIKIEISNAAIDAKNDLETYLKFISDEKRILINKEAILDLNFEQFDAELSGTIEFLNDNNKFKCPTDFSLELKTTNKINFVKTITDFKCDNDKRQLEFQISNVLYGQYYLINNYNDVFCWNLIDSDSKIQDGDNLVLNINKDKKFVSLKQVAYKLKYQFNDLETSFKLLNDKNELISHKKLSSQSDLTGTFCINELNQNLVIEFDSCHLLKPIVNQESFKEISVNKYEFNLKNLFNKNKISNEIGFKSIQHTLKIEINTFLDKSLKEAELTNEFKEIEVHVYEIVGSTSASEEEIIQDREANEKILLKNPRNDGSNHLLFTSTNWFSGEKTYLFKPISKKYLFKPSFTKYKLDSANCNSNLISFNAKLGLFIKGIIHPDNVDGVEVKLKNIDNSLVYTEVSNAKKGFYLGPFESDDYEGIFNKYQIELNKSGYLFKLLNKNIVNGEYLLEYSSEKLGELRVSVVELGTTNNIENVLVSLSSSNKLYRKIIKTNANGLALFENLEADVYYLLVMMQEYEFKPNSQIINVTSGFEFNIGVEAKRIAYSCLGKIRTINGLAVGDVIVEATGIDDGNDNLNCKQSQENTKSDNETGQYRIRGLKPGCKYDINVKQSISSDFYKIIPQNHVVEIHQDDILDINFLLIDNLTLTSEVSLKTNLISSKSSDFKSVTVQKSFRNNIRLKLFKLSQPDSILQTYVVPSNTIFYLPRLARDNQQYLLQIELLTPTALVSAMSAQQQQQQQQQQVAVLDRDEIIFQTDKLFKQLVVNFDLNVKKNSDSSFGSYYDANGQQYQTIYFTLPLFLIVLAIVYFRSNDLIEFFKFIKQKFENSGYLTSSTTTVTIKSNVQKLNPKLSRQQQQQQQTQKGQTSDKSSNELDSSSNSSIDVIDNEGNSISPKKVRIRKA